MAKEGLESKTIQPILKNYCKTTGWALCIGSGTSVPVFPDWNELVRRLMKRDDTVKKYPGLPDSLLREFSPDTLIQATKNIFSDTDNDFSEMLSEELYKDLKESLSESNWTVVKTILESPNPHQIKDPLWRSFIEIADTFFSKTSAYALAEVLLEAFNSDVAPKAILTFNAEALLFSLVNMFERKKFIGKIKKKGEMKTYLDRITHGISNRSSNHIPYVFCHGYLSLPESKRKARLLKAIDKLVFSEDSYLQLSNSSFSWQSSSFLNVCSTNKVVFIGVSLSDSNMRRWLSWIHSNRTDECLKNNLSYENMTEHYWIKKAPATDIEKRWIEASVSHLGIRLVWINEWSEVGITLKRMLGMQP